MLKTRSLADTPFSGIDTQFPKHTAEASVYHASCNSGFAGTSSDGTVRLGRFIPPAGGAVAPGNYADPNRHPPLSRYTESPLRGTCKIPALDKLRA